MKIKATLACVQYIALISCLGTTMLPIQAAPLKIEPIPVLQGSIEHPGQTWLGINKDFNTGLQLLINQRFSLWGTGGKEYLALQLPTQCMWRQEKRKKSDKKKISANPAGFLKSPPVNASECNLQDLSLYLIHFSGGGRIILTPQLVFGVYYSLAKPACLKQLNRYDHQIEGLENKHSVGIELINPLIQWNVSGYWKNARDSKGKKSGGLKNLKRVSKAASQESSEESGTESAEESENSQAFLSGSAQYYTAHETFMFDQWGIATKFAYIYQPSLKVFVSGYYMRFPNEHYDHFDIGSSLGIEYTPTRFLTAVPKIQWDTTHGWNVACAIHLHWRTKNSSTRYQQANTYLTQPLPREQVPSIFKEDFYYKRLKRCHTEVQQLSKEATAKPSITQMKAEYYIGKILASRFPGMRYASSTTSPDPRAQSEQHMRNLRAQFPSYIQALSQNERERLAAFMKDLFPYRPSSREKPHQVFNAPGESTPENTQDSQVAFAPDTKPPASITSSGGKKGKKPKSSSWLSLGSLLGGGKPPRPTTTARKPTPTPDTSSQDYILKAGKAEHDLQEGGPYYASRGEEFITFLLEDLQATKKKGWIPTFRGESSEGRYRLYNNQLTDFDTGEVIQTYRTGDKPIQIKLSTRLTEEGKPDKTQPRLVFSPEGIVSLQEGQP